MDASISMLMVNVASPHIGFVQYFELLLIVEFAVFLALQDLRRLADDFTAWKAREFFKGRIHIFYDASLICNDNGNKTSVHNR